MLGGAMLAAGAAAAQDKVTVAYFLEWPTANQVAQVDKTYDKELGVEVEWRAFGNGNEMNQAMVSGDVDISYSQGFVPFVVGVTNGAPLKLVGIAVTYSENDLCIVRDDAGITKDNAKELEGKKVATPTGNVTHYKLLRTLDHLGVDSSKVEIVQMNPRRRGGGAGARRRDHGLRLRRADRPDEDRGQAADDRRRAGGGRHQHLRHHQRRPTASRPSIRIS